MEDFIVCRCEDVTLSALRNQIEPSAAADVNETKRVLRVGMGACQGRVCGPLAERLLGDGSVGRLRRNTVIRPVALSAIADSASESDA